LVAGITGTYRIAALIILGSTIMAAAALWIENRRRARARSDAVSNSP